MLNSGSKIRAWRDNKIDILTLVLPSPPFQVKWSVPKNLLFIEDKTLYIWKRANMQYDNAHAYKFETEFAVFGIGRTTEGGTTGSTRGVTETEGV